ncbi:Transposase, ISXO2-like domain-containing protein [Strongyloides ratti]|uniref:Transposase, ISXO2-like domain-containing protein n=1 Tax=Strongyloides ratti TaxID=34506 RepID=A0A090MST4_STRRB|nr:Transposase, ISXO2-like domain-containing protein [Strongyloides ratti]CEF61368.1 Transposase, ISXO2-like domain-containing protein [Strongyloides ratti]
MLLLTSEIGSQYFKLCWSSIKKDYIISVTTATPGNKSDRAYKESPKLEMFHNHTFFKNSLNRPITTINMYKLDYFSKYVMGKLMVYFCIFMAYPKNTIEITVFQKKHEICNALALRRSKIKLIKMNPFQLDESIPNETAAVKFLQKRALIPETKECENSHEMKLSFGAANKESSGERMKRKLELDPGTTVDWNSLLGEVCLFMKKKDKNKNGGKGLTVEVDKTLFARRKNHAGRMLGQQWCFGEICRETKECFVEPVADRTSETLMEVLKRRVAPESLIISDM